MDIGVTVFNYRKGGLRGGRYDFAPEVDVIAANES
jgi:hypothetical protein